MEQWERVQTDCKEQKGLRVTAELNRQNWEGPLEKLIIENGLLSSPWLFLFAEPTLQFSFPGSKLEMFPLSADAKGAWAEAEAFGGGSSQNAPQ